MNNKTYPEASPLKSLDEWEEDLLLRYPDPASIAEEKKTEEYRNYDSPARDSVKEFYRLNHTYLKLRGTKTGQQRPKFPHREGNA